MIRFMGAIQKMTKKLRHRVSVRVYGVTFDFLSFTFRQETFALRAVGLLRQYLRKIKVNDYEIIVEEYHSGRVDIYLPSK